MSDGKEFSLISAVAKSVQSSKPDKPTEEDAADRDDDC